jgi:hypothetical protein
MSALLLGEPHRLLPSLLVSTESLTRLTGEIQTQDRTLRRAGALTT